MLVKGRKRYDEETNRYFHVMDMFHDTYLQDMLEPIIASGLAFSLEMWPFN